MTPQKYLEMFLHLLPLLLPLVVYFLFRFVLLTVTMLIMLRAQSLNYTSVGLLGSAALACACDMIPFAGHALAVGVLIFCVIKMTGAHFIDVRFTVAISYAVMFLIQMLVISALPLELPAHARTPSANPIKSLLHLVGKNDEAEDVLPKTGPTNTTATTNQPAAPPAQAVATNSIPATNDPARSPDELAKNFTLKGVVRNARQTTAMIGMGKKTYIFELGESKTLDTADNGSMNVTLEDVTDQGVVLNVGGTHVPLRLR